jgi:hypothetical protein
MDFFGVQYEQFYCNRNQQKVFAGYTPRDQIIAIKNLMMAHVANRYDIFSASRVGPAG